MTEYSTITEFLTLAEPGDRFTETDRRGLTTLIFQTRTDGADGIGGTCTSFSTTHYGRAELSGQREYAYVVLVSQQPTHVDGPVIRRVFSMRFGGTVLVDCVPNAKRYSAARAAKIHHDALARYTAEHSV